jgi:hypothetical protein
LFLTQTIGRLGGSNSNGSMLKSGMPKYEHVTQITPFNDSLAYSGI